MVVLDTNVYLDVARDTALAARVADFVAQQRTLVGISSVVIAELMIGVASEEERRWFLAATVDAVRAEDVLTPSDGDWRRAGDALRALGGEQATWGRSFWNDLLIAATCVRAGATLVTRNADDFRRIQRVMPVAAVPRPA